MNQQHDDNSNPQRPTPSLLQRLAATGSAPLTQTALFATSTWLLLTGLKGLAGFTVNQTTALADLIGILVVLGALRLYAKYRQTPND